MMASSVQRRMLREAAQPLDKIKLDLQDAVKKLGDNAKEYRKLNPDGTAAEWIGQVDKTIQGLISFELVFEKAK